VILSLTIELRFDDPDGGEHTADVSVTGFVEYNESGPFVEFIDATCDGQPIALTRFQTDVARDALIGASDCDRY
jgi:hypothetical protein